MVHALLLCVIGFAERLEAELQQLENARGEKRCAEARVLAAGNRKYQAWNGAAELAAEDRCKLRPPAPSPTPASHTSDWRPVYSSLVRSDQTRVHWALRMQESTRPYSRRH